MATCLKCGENFEGNPRFCPNCGAPMNEEAAQAANSYNNSQNVSSVSAASSSPQSNTVVFMILTLIGGIMCVVGVFLPFVKASVWAYNVEYSFQDLAKTDYIIFIVAGALCVLFGLFKLYLLDTLGGILYGIMLYVDSHDYWQNLKSDSSYGAMASKGAGYYCMLVGCIILVVFGLSGFIMKLKNKR